MERNYTFSGHSLARARERERERGKGQEVATPPIWTIGHTRDFEYAMRVTTAEIEAVHYISPSVTFYSVEGSIGKKRAERAKEREREREWHLGRRAHKGPVILWLMEEGGGRGGRAQEAG